MKKFWSTSAKIHSLLNSQPVASKSDQTLATFPQFSGLSAELRDQIWVYSLEQRVIPLHLRQYPHRESDIEIHAERRNEENEGIAHENDNGAQNDEAGEMMIADADDVEGEEESAAGDGAQSEAEEEGSGDDDVVDPRYEFYTMAILTCSTEGRCKCTNSPPSSIHTVPPPAAFSVCHESRAATHHLYTKYLEAEYTIHGVPATGLNGIPLAVDTRPLTPRPDRKPDPWDNIKSPDYPYPYRTGVFINPAVDALMLDMNISSSESIQELHQFARIMSKQLPNMTRVVISVVIALRPYMWSQKERFGYWKTMGQDARWVPRNMEHFGELRDVVVLLGGKTHQQMLPTEWKERTVGIWKEEMERIREKWPESWVSNGPPILRVVGKLEDM